MPEHNYALEYIPADQYVLEIEPEIQAWLTALPLRHYLRVEEVAELLADRPTTLGEPYSRHLGGPLRELRFNLGGRAIRLTYWLAPLRRIVLLTVFAKARRQESDEVERARQAQKLCDALHGPAQVEFSRTRRENL